MKNSSKRKIEKIETDEGETIFLETADKDDLGTVMFEIDYAICGKDIPTHITTRNLNQINEENIAFFFIAEGGAMGEAGAVYILMKNQKLFYINYLKNGILYDALLKKMPSFENLDFFVGYAYHVPTEFVYYNLGFGNYLLARRNYKNSFNKLLNKLNPNYVHSGELFAKWKYMALTILNNLKNN